MENLSGGTVSVGLCCPERRLAWIVWVAGKRRSCTRVSSSLALLIRTVLLSQSWGARNLWTPTIWVSSFPQGKRSWEMIELRVFQDGRECLLPSPSAGPTRWFQAHIPIHAMTTTDATSSVGLVRKLMRRCLCNQAITTVEKLFPDRFFLFLLSAFDSP